MREEKINMHKLTSKHDDRSLFFHEEEEGTVGRDIPVLVVPRRVCVLGAVTTPFFLRFRRHKSESVSSFSYRGARAVQRFRKHFAVSTFCSWLGNERSYYGGCRHFLRR